MGGIVKFPGRYFIVIAINVIKFKLAEKRVRAFR